MNKLKPKKVLLITRDKHNRNSQDMIVYKDLPLIACKTMNKYNVCNSDRANVFKFDKNEIEITHDGKDNIKIPLDDFRTLFYPAYAITIHKSQGMTITVPYTIVGWNTMNEEIKETARYVALSRAQTMKQVQFTTDENIEFE